MKDYRALALRYLKMNKKRSRITICGVIITTMILFLILNLALSYLLKTREDIREKGDYEMILFTENEEQIAEIIADIRIKTAYVGAYSYYDYDENMEPVTITVDQVLYLNVKNPYQMLSVFQSLCEQYGIKGEMNGLLAETYFQIEGTSAVLVLTLMIFMISFTFAIFGVGIVRNSIQLCILESIRDYGNLRCIGAATGQLKSIIYAQGAILELTGIGIGIIIGTVISMITGAFLHMTAGFHILPVLFILIVFLGDLYFAMQENCKLVVGMTPVSAIRGEYRIQKEKIRLRKNRLITKLLGVDGDYAWKSIMRNSRRFTRTVSSIVFGVAALIAVFSLIASLNHLITDRIDTYGYYPIYFQGTARAYNTITEVQSALPSTEIMERLIAQKEITEGKRMYVSELLFADLDAKYQHYYTVSQEENPDVDFKELCDYWLEKENLEPVVGFDCYGYDETDYRRYQSALTEGTLDVSENGIVLLNYGDIYEEDPDTGMEYTKNIRLTDYQLGDTIEIVDMKELHDRIDGEILELREEEQKEILTLYEQEWDLIEDRNNAENDLLNEYMARIRSLVNDCWSDLTAEGKCKTYTIEGIVDRDVNHYYDSFSDDIRIILPLERYFEMTGTDESMSTGMQYHLSHYPGNGNLASLVTHGEREGYSFVYYTESSLPYLLDELMSWKQTAYSILAIVAFVIIMSALNIINSTASNLHLRRREFAQLRVIGVSKKRLMHMVMLEGVITTVAADGIGIILGLGISYILYWGITRWIGAGFCVPVGAIFLCVLITLLLFCGTIYVSLRNMKQNMAEDLKTGGD